MKTRFVSSMTLTLLVGFASALSAQSLPEMRMTPPEIAAKANTTDSNQLEVPSSRAFTPKCCLAIRKNPAITQFCSLCLRIRPFRPIHIAMIEWPQSSPATGILATVTISMRSCSRDFRLEVCIRNQDGRITSLRL
jgi:hypothetical protein